jgi:methylphosphotriester-DNA--protein-cysteine methyltransferase
VNGDQTSERTRTAFAQLARERPDLSDLGHSVMAAFERMMQGRPELTDGTLTVTNICIEAGISRASYYRSR